MKDPFSILGVSRDATDEQIKAAYRNLVRKYHPDNYDDNNPLKELANEKMQEINNAYDEIQRIRQGTKEDNKSRYEGGASSSTGIYKEIRLDISRRNFKDAERKLYGIPSSEQNAEWHYLNSVILMQKGKVNDAMRELELACSLDPANLEYQQAKQMFNNTAGGYGSTYYGDNQRRRRSNGDDACDCCMNLICLDCLCECMGGDLIRCI